jgi:hypothetical protein
METTYYTCLNQHCAKHRNVFLDGDSEHEHCARTMLRFGEESKRPGWLRWAVPAAAVVAALVAVQVVKRGA